MVGLTEFPDQFAAGMVHGGIVDFGKFIEGNAPTRKTIFDLNISDGKVRAAALTDLSPITKVANIKASVMVQHGATDAQVPVAQGELLVSSLKEHGTPVEYVCFEDEGHWIHKLPNRVLSTMKEVELFEKYLK